MFVQDNKLSSIKKYFIEKLMKNNYAKEEAISVFNILAENKLKKTKLALMIDPELLLSESELIAFNTSLKRLMKNEPVQHIIGHTTFYEREFIVTSDVLIPRPETEELVQWITRDNKGNVGLNILELGSGSGCICITLKLEMPTSEMRAIDISEKALEIAKRNSERLKAKVIFEQTDMLEMSNDENLFDIIVSNPPYVRESEKNEMEQKVLDHEPRLALFVKDDNPLLFYLAIAEYAKKALKKDGMLYFEINQYLGNETVSMLESLGFSNVILRKDLFDNDRMIRAEFIG